MNLIVHHTARAQLDAANTKQVQGVLVYGEQGVGLKTIAEHVFASDDHEIVQPNDKNTISLEIIQSLYTLLRTKRTRLFTIVIDDADAMTVEAQNALLKLLEEPPAETRFILTSHHPERLLATINSRVQAIEIPKSAHKDTESLLDTSLSEQHRSQMLFLAAGYPAELHRLKQDESYFASRVELVTLARDFLKGSTEKRIQIISRFTTDKDICELFLVMLGHLVVFGLDRQVNIKQVESLEYIEKTHKRISQNGNIKLQLAHLSMQLGSM